MLEPLHDHPQSPCPAAGDQLHCCELEQVEWGHPEEVEAGESPRLQVEEEVEWRRHKVEVVEDMCQTWNHLHH